MRPTLYAVVEYNEEAGHLIVAPVTSKTAPKVLFNLPVNICSLIRSGDYAVIMKHISIDYMITMYDFIDLGTITHRADGTPFHKRATPPAADAAPTDPTTTTD